jgi:hypothetical protein
LLFVAVDPGAAALSVGRSLNSMDKVARYEWHGSGVILILLCSLGITIPLAVVYFMSNLLRIDTQVADGTKLCEFLEARK